MDAFISLIMNICTYATNKLYRIRHRLFDRFEFVHINKNGGTSIERALKIPLNHETVQEKIERLGLKNWITKQSFAVVRNPWDRVISIYHYRVSTNQSKLAEDPVSFIDWVHQTYSQRNSKYLNNPKMFMDQVDWITDKQGNIMVNDVLRFENLESDFLKVCDKIGISAKLPKLKSSRHHHYSHYYDEETRLIIGAFHQGDIEMFGYSFDSEEQ